MKTRRTILFSALLGALVACLSCAGSGPRHEYSLAPGNAHHPGLRRALVIPINETAEIPSGLDAQDDRIEALLDRYLGSKGLEVERPSRPDYRRALDQAMREVERERLAAATGKVSGDVTFADVVPALLAGLDAEADLVVVPNLAMRQGQARGGSTYKWDGVRRRETGTAGWNMTGDFPVASIFVAVYRGDGSQVFTGFGGLDTIFEFVESKRKMEIREDLLQNDEYITEGICIAFHPFFGEQERC